jgi:hypothetical protein
VISQTWLAQIDEDRAAPLEHRDAVVASDEYKQPAHF